MQIRICLLAGLALWLVCVGFSGAEDDYESPDKTTPESLQRQTATNPALQAAIREPVDLVSLSNRLVAGNRRTGTLTIVDPARKQCVAEHSVSETIADLAAVRCDTDHIVHPTVLVLDPAREELVRVQFEDAGLLHISHKQQIATVRLPDRMCLIEEQHCVLVSSRWGHQVTVLRFDSQWQTLVKRATVELPFAPLSLLALDDQHKVVVADAFRGRLAVIDIDEARLEHVHVLQGSNIRGLARAGDREAIYVSHQQLNSVGRTEFDDVHWGTLLKHVVRTIPIELLLDPHADLEASDRVWREILGRVGRGKGDPNAIWTDAGGAQAVAIAGTGQIRISHSSYRMTIDVGQRPVAFQAIDDTLFVANQYNDSLTCVTLSTGAVDATISLGPQTPLSARDRGERLFFNARVSHDGWMSCHTCHSDGHTIDELADTLGDGDFGAPKRIPSLLGVGNTEPWGWDGASKSLEKQVAKSIRTTMHGRPLEESQLNDLTTFLRSLTPPPPPDLNMGEATDSQTNLQQQVAKGRHLFQNLGCADCHQPDSYTTPGTYDVGLRDSRGRTQFNPPSLRGVVHRSRLLHDGRATSLEQLFEQFQHQLERPLTPDELTTLTTFLRSL